MLAKALALPSGNHSVTPHLITAEASLVIKFVQQVFEGVERHRLADPNGTLLHAEVAIATHVKDVSPDEIRLRAERWLKE